MRFLLNAHIPLSPSLESLVAQYAAGDLGYGMSVLMASYITLSPAARDQYRALEQLNGVLLNEAEQSDVKEDALDAIMARLDEPEPEEQNVSVQENQDLPAALRELLDVSVEDSDWRFAYPGVKQVKLPFGDNGETVKLLKIKPGKAAPRHTHKGIEATLVLRGAFRDGNRLYERGQLALADQHIQHRPRAEGIEDCICLAVTDGALRFTDSIGRIARDFFAR
ncbi:ChrR family anti-sigma-E factor [Alphaproteobacteria bacterium]|nr:ChrR family anti-sigma-E factor [Alphaproteobacteria bacterium]MDA8779695.1 ChrR family anti-sigma-E factor [Alphaproteobacteria bacterium]MDA9591298.1 ChrR family anti-sigma-E factor [Alphaproteobacteria bacterium]MDB2393593.1 ChrR family anti-sigma-E factor [Alphaproteobacteria bacterium]MDB2406493.1 ChrR family anti-sigma-E factor [Alphaproteobacteria bacterium]